MVEPAVVRSDPCRRHRRLGRHRERCEVELIGHLNTTGGRTANGASEGAGKEVIAFRQFFSLRVGDPPRRSSVLDKQQATPKCLALFDGDPFQMNHQRFDRGGRTYGFDEFG